MSEKEWYSNFRVSRETFDYILSQISAEISHQDTKLRKAIPSAKRLVIYLYYLGSTAKYRTVANLFGVSNAFVCLCIKEVSQAIFKKMKKRILCLPKGDDLKNFMAMYKQRWGFPLCAGAIDGTHIAIQAPPENHADYVNRKSYHPRANGAKRRSERKPGARVTNRALGKLKVVGDGRRAKIIRFLALGMS